MVPKLDRHLRPNLGPSSWSSSTLTMIPLNWRAKPMSSALSKTAPPLCTTSAYKPLLSGNMNGWGLQVGAGDIIQNMRATLDQASGGTADDEDDA